MELRHEPIGRVAFKSGVVRYTCVLESPVGLVLSTGWQNVRKGTRELCGCVRLLVLLRGDGTNRSRRIRIENLSVAIGSWKSGDT